MGVVQVVEDARKRQLTQEEYEDLVHQIYSEFKHNARLFECPNDIFSIAPWESTFRGRAWWQRIAFCDER